MLLLLLLLYFISALPLNCSDNTHWENVDTWNGIAGMGYNSVYTLLQYIYMSSGDGSCVMKIQECVCDCHSP